jgi:hypothetical protein
MSGLGAAWVLALKRIGAHKRTSLAVAFGILLAAVILAFIPAYHRAMADLGLRFHVTETAGETATLRAVSTGTTLADVPFAEQRVTEAVNATSSWFLEPSDVFIETRPLQYQPPGEALPLNVRMIALRSMPDRVAPSEGRTPSGPGEAAVAPNVAAALGVGVGDRLDVRWRLTNCFPPPPADNPFVPPVADPCNDELYNVVTLSFEVVGIVEPLVENDIHLDFGADPSRITQGGDESNIYPVVVDYAAMRTALAAAVPPLPISGHWIYEADLASLSSPTALVAQRRLTALSDDLRRSDILVISRVEDALRAFDRSASFSRAPIIILALQIAAVVLVYVGIVSGLLAQELVEETALFRGRGASLGQVFALAALEGLTYAVPAALIAPFAAAGLVSLLGHTPLFEDVTAGALPFSLTPSAFAYAGGGALLAIVTMAIPVAASARRRLLEGRRQQARGTGKPIYQRYFLDAGVVAVAGILIFELYRQDTVFEPNAFGGLSSDPMLLFAPAIFSLATVAILLRVFPLGVRLAARVLRPTAGPAGEIALTNLARSSATYARLAVLLTLVFALGAFAATYAPTVDLSYRERTEFSVGPEVRFGLGQLGRRPPEAARTELGGIDGVETFAAVWRGPGFLGLDRSLGARFQVLAVDARQVPELIEWRDDFAPGKRPEQLFGSLSVPVGNGLELPGRPDTLSIDVNGNSRASTIAWASLRDAAGEYHRIDMGELQGDQWERHSARLDSTFTLRGEIRYPLTLMALQFTSPEGSFTSTRQPILIDRIAVQEGERETIVESFESGAGRWDRMARDPNVDDRIATATAAGTPDGTQVLQLTTAIGRNPQMRGIYVRGLAAPLPALVSREFAAAAGVGPGSTAEVVIDDRAVPITVIDTLDLFPTLEAGGRGFVILDLDALIDWSRRANGSLRSPSEGWMSLEPGASATEVALEVRSQGIPLVVIRDEEVRRATTNPIISAGASGLLGVGFIVSLSVLCLAMVLSLVLDAERRVVPTSVLRAVGLAPRSIFGALAIEYGAVVALGSVLGLVLGLQVSALMLRFLEVTETGQPVLPPFALTTNWSALGLALAVLAAVATAAVFMAGMYLRRVSVSRAIRLSE